MSDEINMTPLTNGEKARTYIWDGLDGDFVRDRIENVTHICVRSSGTHRLKTADGKLHVVPVGWVRIEIEADEWSV